MWVYEQSTGVLKLNDKLVSVGYSGLGKSKNNPSDEAIKNAGPIPCGVYSITGPENVDHPGPHGPFVLRLTPAVHNQMFGRDGFLIHGDSVSNPGTASNGCIILARVVRERIVASKDRHLQVIRGII